MTERTIAADFAWTGNRFERDRAVHINERGVIVKIAKSAPSDDVLKNHALLPGFVSAHSHAFQRGLRAQSQRFSTGAGNFWTWRETMYRLAEALDVDAFYETSKQCFKEMLLAGMTSVGEFHYLHHAGADCRDWAFDDAIVSAARDAGIRMTLIQTYYATGAIGKPLEAGAQQRFGPVSREQFVKQMDRIAGQLDARTQSLGLACHSIRAASIEDIIYFRDYASSHAMPFHIHVEEARKEISDCIDSLGTNPLRVLLDRIKIDEHVTAIHLTHSALDDLREYISRGGRICLCPITEGNLSDGFPDVPAMRSSGGKICIGTDSNIRLSMNEELRWLELGQRLRREQRGIVVDSEGCCASALFAIGTKNSADSIHVNAGEIQVGERADVIAINLDHPSMRDCEGDAILDSLIFGSGNGAIDRVWVGGNAVNL